MKIFRFFLIVVAFCVGLTTLQAQQLVFNHEDEDVMLLSLSGGAGFIISAHGSYQIESADTNYYAFLLVGKNPQEVKKIGFCRLFSDDGNYIFSVNTKLPIFLVNNSEQNVLLEFTDMVVSLPPRASYQADNFVVEPDLTALVYLSGDKDSVPDLRLLHFELTRGVLSAKLW